MFGLLVFIAIELIIYRTLIINIKKDARAFSSVFMLCHQYLGLHLVQDSKD